MFEPTHQVLFQFNKSIYSDAIVENYEDRSFSMKYLFPKCFAYNRYPRFSLSTSAPTIVRLSSDGKARSIHDVLSIENQRDHAMLLVSGNFTESRDNKCQIIGDFIQQPYTVDPGRERCGIFKLVVKKCGRVETL
jgi:hypothetical protein